MARDPLGHEEASIPDLDALLAAPVVGALLCQGCEAEVEVRDGPDVAVQEGVRTFIAAHARCSARSRRTSLEVDVEREP